MKKYFKLVGVCLLILCAIGFIFYIRLLVPVFSDKHLDGWDKFGYILGLISLMIFGPAIGCVFIFYSDLIESISSLHDKIDNITSIEKNEDDVLVKVSDKNPFQIGSTVILKEEACTVKNQIIKAGTEGIVSKKYADRCVVFFNIVGDVEVENDLLESAEENR